MEEPAPSGDFIRTEIIEAAGLTVTSAAIALRVARPTLSSLLNRRADLSGDMALRIGKAFGVKMDALMGSGNRKARLSFGLSPTCASCPSD